MTFRDCLGILRPFPAMEPIYTYGADPANACAPSSCSGEVAAASTRRSTPTSTSSSSAIALERIEGRTIARWIPGHGFTFARRPLACAATEACTWRGRVMRGEVHERETVSRSRPRGMRAFSAPPTHFWNLAVAMLAAEPGLAATPLSQTRTHGWERKHSGWSGGAGLLCRDDRPYRLQPERGLLDRPRGRRPGPCSPTASFPRATHRPASPSFGRACG